jgi:hypothetical protein
MVHIPHHVSKNIPLGTSLFLHKRRVGITLQMTIKAQALDAYFYFLSVLNKNRHKADGWRLRTIISGK